MFQRIATAGLLSVGVFIIMLGPMAEAHYMYARGRWVHHSVGCIAEIEDVPNPGTVPASVECVVNTAQVETLCEGLSGLLNTVISTIPISLDARNPIVPDDVTGRTAEVEVIVPDEPLLDVDINPVCVNSTPTDVLIRDMTSTVTIFECAGPAAEPCSVRLVASTATAQCELPAQFNLDSYPANLPPEGTPYICTNPVVEHLH